MIKIQELISPNFSSHSISFSKKLKSTLLLYIVSLFLTVVSIILIHLIGYTFGFYNEIKVLLDKSLRTPSYYNVLLMLLIGPILEEFVFRAFLSFRKITLVASTFFLLVRFAPDFSYYRFPNKMFIIQISIAAIISILLYIFLNLKFIEKLKTNFSIFFWLSVILFAFVHLKNFEDLNNGLYFLYPLLVLPQFFMGYLLAYTRIKNGFIWGCLLHVMINFIPALVMFLSLDV